MDMDIVNYLLFWHVLSLTYWITCFSVIAQDCVESVLYYARIALYTESSVEEQIQSIKVEVIYCIVAVVVLPLTFTNAQCMYKACLTQKRIFPKCSHCKQRKWKIKNLKVHGPYSCFFGCTCGWVLAMLLHLIALGNVVRVYPGIVQGLMFYLYKNK